MNKKLDILQMLHDGTISVDEASQLLEAVSDADLMQKDIGTASSNKPPEPPTALRAPHPPDIGRLRRLSYIPLAISLPLLALTGWGSYALYTRAEGRITLGFVLLLILCFLALLITALALWAATVPWLHVRIHSAGRRGSGQTRFAISFPVPLTLAGWGLRIAHRFVEPDAADHLRAAAGFVQAIGRDLGKPGTEPIVVDVDDEDERVQVYIG